MKGPHTHVVNSIPNNRMTRWLIGWVNRRMARDGSRWMFKMRWRKPRKGHRFGPWGDLQKHSARRIALYLVLNAAGKREENMRRRRIIVVNRLTKDEVVSTYKDGSPTTEGRAA